MGRTLRYCRNSFRHRCSYRFVVWYCCYHLWYIVLLWHPNSYSKYHSFYFSYAYRSCGLWLVYYNICYGIRCNYLYLDAVYRFVCNYRGYRYSYAYRQYYLYHYRYRCRWMFGNVGQNGRPWRLLHAYCYRGTCYRVSGWRYYVNYFHWPAIPCFKHSLCFTNNHDTNNNGDIYCYLCTYQWYS